jgi:stage III sporulation protein AF
MISFVREWITEIIGLLVLIVLMEMLLPSGRTRKYANLVTGFILILAIITPPLRFFGAQTMPDKLIMLRDDQIDRTSIKMNSKMFEEEQMNQIVEVYRLKIINQLENLLKDVKGVDGAKADVIINENYSSPAFGEIKRVYLEVYPKKDDGLRDADTDKKSVLIDNVKKVSIKEVKNGGTDEEKTKHAIEGELADRIRERVRSIYGVAYENIVISELEE